MNSVLIALLIIPFVAALLLAIVGSRPYAALLSAGASIITFFVAIVLTLPVFQHGGFTAANEWFYIDSFSAYLILLTSFIGATTAIFSIDYLKQELKKEKLNARSIRFYHSMYQLFMFAMLLALLSNNLGMLWVAMEAATLATVLLVSIYRTPAAIEAAWKYLILCGVGIAQALLGTILLYFAAEKILSPEHALLWTQLYLVSHSLAPKIVSLAFILFLVGYGTKAGLVPMHNWLPDAHGEGPAPVSALLSGLLLNIALYAIIRCKIIVDGATGTALTNHLLLGFGLLNILVAAFFLLRQREIKRLFAYSSIEHIGIISFAFGLATPIATFAALLHMAVHSLSKTAVFFASGQAIQRCSTQMLAQMKGLMTNHPSLAWGLLFGTFAILGIPPFGIFTSEFLIIMNTVQQQPWLTPLLIIGIIIAFAAILDKMQTMLFSEVEENAVLTSASNNLFPMYFHLVLVLLIGITVPAFLLVWFRQITAIMTTFL